MIVHFENDLEEESGIHWHGIELANASDGTPLVQNQVEPGDTFLYKFEVTRPGIYWYHPHHHASTNQVFKGLYGTIIITDPNEAALQASGVLPSQANTKTLALSDITVCKAPGSNDAATFDPTLPHVSGGGFRRTPAPRRSPSARRRRRMPTATRGSTRRRARSPPARSRRATSRTSSEPAHPGRSKKDRRSSPTA